MRGTTKTANRTASVKNTMRVGNFWLRGTSKTVKGKASLKGTMKVGSLITSLSNRTISVMVLKHCLLYNLLLA